MDYAESRLLAVRTQRTFPSICGLTRVLAAVTLLAASTLFPAQTKPPAEYWLTNAVAYPQPPSPGAVQTNRFERVRAEYLVETLRVLWTPSTNDAATNVVLRLSVDKPGHWRARDWRSLPMQRRGANWETTVLVDSLDIPLVYYVFALDGEGAHLSPMRLCQPRELGLDFPTRVFWPFLEGFEEGAESWQWLAGGPADGHFEFSSTVKNGKSSLAVRVERGRTSATVGTTRLRGWRIAEHGAAGISMWLRTTEGTGRARFALFANAFATNQILAVRSEEAPIGSQWQRHELTFQSFGKVPLAEIDLFSVEVIGRPGTVFLMDDIQMTGPWPPD